MKFRIGVPSPALVISCIALFVAMSGVSYAVATGSIDSREIKNNSIRTQDIRNSNVTGRDVAADTLGGQDIVESKLGPVPRASNADAVGGVPASQYARKSGSGPAALALQFPTQAADPAPTYEIDSLGFVHLTGGVKDRLGTISESKPETLAVLPANARPSATRYFAVAAQGADTYTSRIRIDPDGSVRRSGQTDANNELLTLFLDGIVFKAGG